MGVKTLQFLSLLFTALALAPAMAHVLELPNKIGLPRDAYFTVQQIYRGWAFLGIVIIGAIVFTLCLTALVRHQSKQFSLVLIALGGIVGSQIVFWTFTYPANLQTNNWTMLPENWQALRQQWEYAHAAGAGLTLIALIALIASVLVSETCTEPR